MIAECNTRADYGTTVKEGNDWFARVRRSLKQAVCAHHYHWRSAEGFYGQTCDLCQKRVGWVVEGSPRKLAWLRKAAK